ncbi:Uncharacterized protein FWK35_00020404, partial [Aphis craccivora]
TNKVIAAAAENVNVIKAPCARAIDCGEFLSFVVSLFFLLSRSHLRFFFYYYYYLFESEQYSASSASVSICYNTNTYTHTYALYYWSGSGCAFVFVILLLLLCRYIHYPAREFPFVSLA